MKSYCFDIDGTLTEQHKDTPLKAVPRYERIAIVNKLYDEGAIVHLMTSRGMIKSEGNPQEAEKYMRLKTEEQLRNWGVKYHKLYFGKPRVDYYVDDRGINDMDFFK